MTFIIAGLGNPEKEYKDTRHNAGRIVLERFRAAHSFPEWRKKGAHKALVSEGEVEGEDTILVEPDNYMNNSGKSVAPLVKEEGKPEHLIVIYDDLDLAIGEFKISFGRGSGGHKGVESIITELGTKDFVRIRVGISPKTFFGVTKKPKGEERVHRFIMGQFTGGEQKKLKAQQENIENALRTIITAGYKRAMNEYNA